MLLSNTLLLLLLIFVYSSYSFGIFQHENRYTGFRRNLEKLRLNSTAAITTKYISQPLDHFHKEDNRTWMMRYFERPDFWQASGPIVIYIGGEYPAGERFLGDGNTPTQLAKDINAALFMTEHRYYGESIPMNDTVDLTYLSSRQALADLAHLIKYLKGLDVYKTSKVIVIGGSYAGNLAAWSRLLYPDLIDAAWASSAPVLAKLDFYEYFETTADDFKNHGTPGCYETAEKMFHDCSDKMKTPEGRKQLQEQYNICNNVDLTYNYNQMEFFSSQLDDFASSSQDGPLDSIEFVCYDIMNRTSEQCLDTNFDGMISVLINSNSWSKMWFYQTCTEFGYFQTTSRNQLFTNGLPKDYYTAICLKAYNVTEEQTEQAIRATNDLYGGRTPNVTKVIFINGALDPWHNLGVLEDLSDLAPARLVPMSFHCQDLSTKCTDEPKELTEARTFAMDQIKKWIE